MSQLADQRSATPSARRSAASHVVVCRHPRRGEQPRCWNDPLPDRRFDSGWDADIEADAKKWAGHVHPLRDRAGCTGNQPYVSPAKFDDMDWSLVITTVGKRQQTKIPLESSWVDSQRAGRPYDPDEFGVPLDGSPCPPRSVWYGNNQDWARWSDPGCYRYLYPFWCYSGPAQSRHQPLPPPQGRPRLEQELSADGSWVEPKERALAFDDKPWLDTMPIDDFAKVGYTNWSNDHEALDNAEWIENDRDMVWMKGFGPGETWADSDREHRKAKRQKPATEDVELPDPHLLDAVDRWLKMSPEERRDADPYVPAPLRSQLAGLRGRFCRNCGGRYELRPEQGTKTAYYSERCRNRAEYLMRRPG